MPLYGGIKTGRHVCELNGTSSYSPFKKNNIYIYIFGCGEPISASLQGTGGQIFRHGDR